MPPKNLMPEEDFEFQLRRYRELAIAAADLRREAARMETDRAEWVGNQIMAKVEAGLPVTRADKEVHADAKHREFQRQVATLSAEAAKDEILARVAELRCLYLTARREGVPA